MGKPRHLVLALVVAGACRSGGGDANDDGTGEAGSADDDAPGSSDGVDDDGPGSTDADDVIRFCQLLEPTVGGINLEDIRAPDCFRIEEELRRTLNIPVFHDDQHGTAIISGAALLNALEVVDKPIDKVRVVFSGAGASAIATAEHYVRLGVRRENIILCDREGVVYEGRPKPYDQYKPDQTAWCHSMYGACHDREFCIQVVTDADLAPAFHADVRGYVRLYPKDHRNAWQLLGNVRVNGMHAMLAAASETFAALRFACVLRMPHPTDPDPKA